MPQANPAGSKHSNGSGHREDRFRSVSYDRLTWFVGVSWLSRSSADTMQSEYGWLETDYCAHPPRAVRQGSAGTARESLRKNQRRHGGVRTCAAVREFGAEL